MTYGRLAVSVVGQERRLQPIGAGPAGPALARWQNADNHPPCPGHPASRPVPPPNTKTCDAVIRDTRMAKNSPVDKGYDCEGIQPRTAAHPWIDHARVRRACDRSPGALCGLARVLLVLLPLKPVSGQRKAKRRLSKSSGFRLV
ncbi:hypothetical protein GCM10017667_69930 [Streptomyces filamentosus]|uniref:Uncharacterized protein n=1 Tax=Streptomyces filamentosus TaxID=67294 RepID=A0A919BVH2_STRFL|nr:hypothetical protein GCM10017667_69930 [Streptomyces filamentosus]